MHSMWVLKVCCVPDQRNLYAKKCKYTVVEDYICKDKKIISWSTGPD